MGGGALLDVAFCDVVVVVVAVADVPEGERDFAVAFATSQHLLDLKIADLGNRLLLQDVAEMLKNI